MKKILVCLILFVQCFMVCACSSTFSAADKGYKITDEIAFIKVITLPDDGREVVLNRGDKDFEIYEKLTKEFYENLEATKINKLIYGSPYWEFIVGYTNGTELKLVCAPKTIDDKKRVLVKIDKDCTVNNEDTLKQILAYFADYKV